MTFCILIFNTKYPSISGHSGKWQGTLVRVRVRVRALSQVPVNPFVEAGLSRMHGSHGSACSWFPFLGMTGIRSRQIFILIRSVAKKNND